MTQHPPATKSSYVYLCVVVCACASGCGTANGPREYRESRGETIRVGVTQGDKSLRIVVFTRLKDGTIERPRILVQRARFGTFGGVEWNDEWEQWTVANAAHQFIDLPVADEISGYLLLVSTTILVPDASLASGYGRSKWTQWRLLEFDAAEVQRTKSLSIPKADEHADSETDADDAALLGRLRSEADRALAEGLVE